MAPTWHATSLERGSREFKADHPFFIVLHHKPTRTRLFMGRIASV